MPWRYHCEMKVTITVPDEIFRAAEILALKLHKSRSQLYVEALTRYIAAHSAHEVTQRLNEVLAREPSRLDGAWLVTQARGLMRETW